MKTIYLPNSIQVLLSQDGRLKLVSRGSRGQGEFFNRPRALFLGNVIRDVLDTVSLFISFYELECLINMVDWQKYASFIVISSFLNKVKISFNGSSIKVTFLEGLPHYFQELYSSNPLSVQKDRESRQIVRSQGYHSSKDARNSQR